MKCKNVFCQSFENDADSDNCQVTFSFNREGCEKRKLFNKLMREPNYQIFRDKLKAVRKEHE